MYVFIVNPAAGKGGGALAIPIIERVMSESGKAYKIMKTRGTDDVIAMSKQAVLEGASVVAAVGGDGTLNEVAGCLVGSDTALGVIAAGSGNDFAASLNMNQKRPKNKLARIEADIRRIVNGSAKPIDVIAVNGSYAVNITHVGMDASIGNRANITKKKYGKLSYLIATIQHCFTYKPFDAEITIDNNLTRRKVFLVAAANARFYGGGFPIAPGADMADGLIRLCIVEAMPRLKLLLLFPSIFFAAHERIREVKMYDCKSVEVMSDTPLLSLDGNITEVSGKQVFEIIENGIKLVV